MDIATHSLFLLFLAAVPACAGAGAAKHARRIPAALRRAAGPAILLTAAAWFALVLLARRYAETDHPGWMAAECFAHSGKWYIFAAFVCALSGAALRGGIAPGWRRVAVIAATALVLGTAAWRTSPLYPWIAATALRDARGHLRQTTEHTCGPVALGNLFEMERGIPAPTERELARLAGTTVEGTTTRDLLAAAAQLGLAVSQCRVMTFAELRALDGPALVSISTLPSVHHATVLLRMDPPHAFFLDPDYGEWRTTIAHAQQILYGKTITLAGARKLRAAAGTFPVDGSLRGGEFQ